MPISVQRPPGSAIKVKLKVFPEDAPPEDVIRCKMVFDYKMSYEFLKYLEREGKHRAKRGTNIVHEWSCTDKGFLKLELRSGYFNGRPFREQSVMKKASELMQEIGMELASVTSDILQYATLERMAREKISLFECLFAHDKVSDRTRKRMRAILKEVQDEREAFTLYSMKASHDLANAARRQHEQA